MSASANFPQPVFCLPFVFTLMLFLLKFIAVTHKIISILKPIGCLILNYVIPGSVQQQQETQMTITNGLPSLKKIFLHNCKYYIKS
jgi:hypothetical protein